MKSHGFHYLILKNEVWVFVVSLSNTGVTVCLYTKKLNWASSLHLHAGMYFPLVQHKGFVVQRGFCCCCWLWGFFLFLTKLSVVLSIWGCCLLPFSSSNSENLGYCLLSLFALKDFICFVGTHKSPVFPLFVEHFFPPKKEQKQCENVFWALSCTLHIAICTQNLLQKQNLLLQVSEQWDHCWKESENRAWRERSRVFQSYRHKLWLMKYLKNPSRQLAFDSNCW